MHIDDISYGQWKALVKKLPREVQVYWDYRDELGEEQIAQIMSGPEGADQVEMELIQLNGDEEWRMQNDAIQEVLNALDLHELDPSQVLDEIREQGVEKLYVDVNLRDLARHTRGVNLVVHTKFETQYMGYRGIRNSQDVADLTEMCRVLNINPRHLQKHAPKEEERESWDTGSLEFPDHPERDGHELMSVQDFLVMLDNNMYPGNLVFLFRLNGDEILDQIEDLKRGPICVKAGTEALIYTYDCGSGSVEGALVRDLVLQPGDYEILLDAECRYGIQSCYGLTEKPWKAGNVIAIETHE